MADIEKLYKWYATDVAHKMLADAEAFAKKKPEIGWGDIQTELKVGYEPAIIIFDWLADNHLIDAEVSDHWLRAAKMYVFNNPGSDLLTMQERLKIGEQRAFAAMQLLAKKGYIQVTPEFEFKRVGRGASFKDLVRQMQVVAKKYNNRCEPNLLIRTIFVDPTTAFRLAQYGEEYLGLYWKYKIFWENI